MRRKRNMVRTTLRWPDTMQLKVKEIADRECISIQELLISAVRTFIEQDVCGDTHCSSCGPAQGNWRCVICRAWADDGCDHIREDAIEYKDEFRLEAEQIMAAEQEAEANYYNSLAQQEAEAAEYWKNRDRED